MAQHAFLATLEGAARELHRNGSSVKDIATQLGVMPATVEYWKKTRKWDGASNGNGTELDSPTELAVPAEALPVAERLWAEILDSKPGEEAAAASGQVVTLLKHAADKCSLDEKKCMICGKVSSDFRYALFISFIRGYPPPFLERIFGINHEILMSHAYGADWYGARANFLRRNPGLRIDTNILVADCLWETVTESSAKGNAATRLAALQQLTALDPARQVKRRIKGGFSLEEFVGATPELAGAGEGVVNEETGEIGEIVDVEPDELLELPTHGEGSK